MYTFFLFFPPFSVTAKYINKTAAYLELSLGSVSAVALGPKQMSGAVTRTEAHMWDFILRHILGGQCNGCCIKCHITPCCLIFSEVLYTHWTSPLITDLNVIFFNLGNDSAIMEFFDDLLMLCMVDHYSGSA